MGEALPFNSPLETGLRALINLAAIAPEGADLQRLVLYDYIVVHSADIGGPVSIHPNNPSRGGELIIRRGLVEKGLMLMASRGLLTRDVDESGILFRATEEARPFLDGLVSPYICALSSVADWVADNLHQVLIDELQRELSKVVANKNHEFFDVHDSSVETA
jgi:hypothetical protein